MELDYQELQAVVDMRRRFKRERSRGDKYRALATIAFFSSPLILLNHSQPRIYPDILVVCLIALGLYFSLAETLYQRRRAKQLSLLLDIAQRAMDSDPANQQKFNELQVLNTAK